MQIVIDIDENLYTRLFDNGVDNYDDAVDMAKSIRKGKPLDSVLDKIRAEIEQAADKQFQIAMGVTDLNERYTHIQMENAYRHSLNIIDKYKAENEEKAVSEWQ